MARRLKEEISTAESLSLVLPDCPLHPNRIPFDGCLTFVDTASDKAPSGSRGHRVILTRSAAIAALPGLLGMAVGYKVGWDGHDARQKCGVITAAYFDKLRLMVSGIIFGHDYPEIREQERSAALGMSYELIDAHVEDLRASTWTISRATFTGAAILLKETAAYPDTSFRIVPSTSCTAAVNSGNGPGEPIALCFKRRRRFAKS